MLLDPLEEQLNLPASLVELCDCEGRESELVREKDVPVAVFEVVVADSSQRDRVLGSGRSDLQYHCLVTDQTCGSVHRIRVAADELKVALGAGNEDGFRLLEPVQPFEIEVCAVEDVDRAGFG